jgi:hypothetical protein
MPPKKKGGDSKGGKGGKGKDGEVDVAVQMRKVKTEMSKAIADLQIHADFEVDRFLNAKVQECLASSSTKLIFTGDRPCPANLSASTHPAGTGIRNMTQLDVMVFSRAVKQLTPAVINLKALCLWKSLLGDDGMRDLCQFVLPLPELVNMEVIDCQVSVRGCEYLAQSLRMDSVKLAYLSLDFNAFGDDGVTILAEGLKYNKDLATLSLAYCKIGPAGGCVIGDEVIRASMLKRIRLPGNRIMEQGVLAIARNLGKSTVLLELDISDNSVGPDLLVMNNLCEGLRTNASLEELNYEHNALSVEGAILLKDSLAMCSNIKKCRVSGQGMSSDLFKEVCKDGKAAKKKGKKGKKKK